MKKLEKHFKSATELGRVCGVSRQAAWQWMRGATPIGLPYCAAIEQATGGKLRAELLRPDVTWERSEDGRLLGYFVEV